MKKIFKCLMCGKLTFKVFTKDNPDEVIFRCGDCGAEYRFRVKPKEAIRAKTWGGTPW